MRIERSLSPRATARQGQALMELAVGMFALAIVVSLLCMFVRYIVKSLNIQNHLRTDTAIFAAKVEGDPFVTEKVIGVDTLHIKEPRGSAERVIRNEN